MAWRDGELLVTAPEPITLLEVDGRNPVTAGSLKYGLRLVAIAFPYIRRGVGPTASGSLAPALCYDLEYRSSISHRAVTRQI